MGAVSSPQSSPPVGKRLFSVVQANRSLVLVRRIVADVVRDYRRLRTLKESYEAHDQRGEPVQAEQARQGYVGVFNRLSELRDELEDIGCELRDCDLGLVDFPAMLNGRQVVLCWKLGEETVEFWRELDGGFNARRRLTPED